MKTTKDRFLRNVSDTTWIELRKLSIELEVPMRILLEILLENYKLTNKAA